jgi:hypothetical protein
MVYMQISIDKVAFIHDPHVENFRASPSNTRSWLEDSAAPLGQE